MRFAGAVREKLRHCTCLLVAVNRLSPEENMLDVVVLERVEAERKVINLPSALGSNGNGNEGNNLPGL